MTTTPVRTIIRLDSDGFGFRRARDAEDGRDGFTFHSGLGDKQERNFALMNHASRRAQGLFERIAKGKEKQTQLSWCAYRTLILPDGPVLIGDVTTRTEVQIPKGKAVLMRTYWLTVEAMGKATNGEIHEIGAAVEALSDNFISDSLTSSHLVSCDLSFVRDRSLVRGRPINTETRFFAGVDIRADRERVIQRCFPSSAATSD